MRKRKDSTTKALKAAIAAKGLMKSNRGDAGIALAVAEATKKRRFKGLLRGC